MVLLSSCSECIFSGLNLLFSLFVSSDLSGLAKSHGGGSVVKRLVLEGVHSSFFSGFHASSSVFSAFDVTGVAVLSANFVGVRDVDNGGAVLSSLGLRFDLTVVSGRNGVHYVEEPSTAFFFSLFNDDIELFALSPSFHEQVVVLFFSSWLFVLAFAEHISAVFLSTAVNETLDGQLAERTPVTVVNITELSQIDSFAVIINSSLEGGKSGLVRFII